MDMKSLKKEPYNAAYPEEHYVWMFQAISSSKEAFEKYAKDIPSSPQESASIIVTQDMMAQLLKNTKRLALKSLITESYKEGSSLSRDEFIEVIEKRAERKANREASSNDINMQSDVDHQIISALKRHFSTSTNPVFNVPDNLEIPPARPALSIKEGISSEEIREQTLQQFRETIEQEKSLAPAPKLEPAAQISSPDEDFDVELSPAPAM